MTIGDRGGFGRPVRVILHLQGQVHVTHPWRFVFATEQGGEEGRGPALIGDLKACRVNVREK